MNVKILIVDDHELIINGVKNMLSPYPRYQIVGQVENGLDVRNMCQKTEPDMVILDLGLPGMDGQDVSVDLLRRWPRLRILALTARQEEYYVSQILNIGALGYVLKKSPQEVLLAAIQTIMAGKRYIDPALDHDHILQLMKTCQLLTPRERQVLKLITEGACNRIIAEKLTISKKTVETHRLNMMRKLDAHKVVHLIEWSRRLGLTHS
ncbi:two component system response regulator [Candidatus Regiella endosymbiont of Tuberolachnus salignus]|uniref:two component system response regulator n=1 Tax=Candidatus Regiella endosymbiont of Tuberolachnus salignus TaxID=3077956 RepID=UPI0030D39AD3